MSVRQLLTNASTFAVVNGNATTNVDIYQAVAWAPLSPVFNTGKVRAYFEDTPAGEALAQSLYDQMVERTLYVQKNWA